MEGATKHITHVAAQALRRSERLCNVARFAIMTATFKLPQVNASNTNSTDFTARPPHSNETDQVGNDIDSMTGLFNLQWWSYRGHQIRDGNTRTQCIGNLSLALSGIGPLATSSSQGASGALSLLPTAGALIGAPAKELWVLYKLMPLAGVLSMILSLGGNIVPMDSADYEVSNNAFSYAGLIATDKATTKTRRNTNSSGGNLSPAAEFAEEVVARAEDTRIPTKAFTIAVGVFFQLCWLTILMFACYFTQVGGVVAWWCQAWGWMYFWYLTVASSSLLENFAGVPFTKQWTIRVSKSPRIRISESAPIVAPAAVVSAVTHSHSLLPGLPLGQVTSLSMQDEADQSLMGHQISDHLNLVTSPPRMNSFGLAQTPSDETDSTPNHDPAIPKRNSHPSHRKPLPDGSRMSQATMPTDSRPMDEKPSVSEVDILQSLDAGFNTESRVFMDPDEPYSVSRTPFYVIISLKGISKSHAALRVFSKAISVGVFAAGTATFASATLITISVALTALCLVLAAGVFGRVAALWMASEMMETDPVLHRVLRDRQEAAEFIEAILRKPGLTFEIMGHVIIDGRCVYRYNSWLRWCTLFGVLAPPFNVARLALSGRK